jgi:hypothetical protein
MEGNHRSLKIFLAVFAGSLIGGLACRHIGFPFWFLGLLIGGLVGYLAYEPLAVLKAIPVAWRWACREMKLSGRLLRENWRTILLIFFAGELAFFWVFVPITFLTGEISRTPLSVWLIGSFMCFCMSFCVFYLMYDLKEGNKVWREYKFFLTHLNPVSLVLYTIPVYWFRTTWYMIKGCWHHRQAPLIAGRFLGLFFWKLFLIIHSQERLLCFIDASIGAALVYFIHYSPLYGALIGALFGVVNFEILSKRVLKIALVKAH